MTAFGLLGNPIAPGKIRKVFSVSELGVEGLTGASGVVSWSGVGE